MEGGGIGRGRADGSIMQRQSVISIDDDESLSERSVGCVNGERGTNETGGTRIFRPYEHLDAERSIGWAEESAVDGGELDAVPRIISVEHERGRDISATGAELHRGQFQLASVPLTEEQTFSNKSHDVLSESPTAMQPTGQKHNTSLPTVLDTRSCQSCDALLERTDGIVAEMEIKLDRLSEMIFEINRRLDKMGKPTTTTAKSRCRQSEELFTDKRLLRVKAAALVTGRQLTPYICRRLVLNITEYEPPFSFNGEDIEAINVRRDCRDAPSLSKWAVYEMFSLQELVGRNCLGGGHDKLAGTDTYTFKKPFDECKMETIKAAVFKLYPQEHGASQKAAWMKCVDKINTDIRYLFKVSLKKHDWLQLGLD